MSEDFWKPDLSTIEKRTAFGVELAISLLTDQCDPVRVRMDQPGSRLVELGLELRFRNGKRISNVELLAIEVLRHYAEGQKTPPHLAASFLDECMANLGEKDEPVTEIWLASRGFSSAHDNEVAMKFIKLNVGSEKEFGFWVRSKCRTVYDWVITDGCGGHTKLGSGPTAAQVLTVGRALGIPTERKS